MKKILFISFILLVLMISACGPTGSSNTEVSIDPVPAEYVGMTNPFGADVADAGSELFQTNCSSCHGSEGRGDGPAATALNPTPKNLAVIQSQVGDDYLYWKISNGSPGTAMVAWRGILTEDQIWQIVSFIRTLE